MDPPRCNSERAHQRVEHASPRQRPREVRSPRQRPAPRRRAAPQTRPAPQWLTSLVAKCRRFRDRRPDAARLLLAVLVGLLGLSLAGGAALADAYLHRGVETGAAAPYVLHPSGRGLGTNIDLTTFPAGDVEGTVEALRQNGFRFVRQSFPWSAIEPEPGRFAWERYDAIVDALVAHGIQPVAVIHGTPRWARDNANPAASDAPPTASEAYATFVGQLATRYAGRVTSLQLWDLPNRPDRWGGQTATPGQFLGLFAPASNEVRRVAPDTQVLLPELDPRPLQGFDDVAFLRQLYELGAEPFFDVVAARVDGGTGSPLDRRIQPGGAGLSRTILLREVMVEAGDTATPVWATRYGWPTSSGPQAVSPLEQAEFAVAGLERTRDEWPWLGTVFAWALLPSDPEAAGGYALLTADGSPTPLFTALSGYAAGDAAVATPGYAPVDSGSVTFRGTWSEQNLPPWRFRVTAEEGATVTIRFRGTGLLGYLRRSPNASAVDLVLDGEPVSGWGDDALRYHQASDVWLPLVSGLDDETHELTLTLAEPGELAIGGVVVTRDVPFMWPVVLLTAGGALLLFFALREILYLFGVRYGYLQRRRGTDLWPALPQLADWNAGRRA